MLYWKTSKIAPIFTFLLRLLGDVVPKPQTPDRGFAPGPHWGTSVPKFPCSAPFRKWPILSCKIPGTPLYASLSKLCSSSSSLRTQSAHSSKAAVVSHGSNSRQQLCVYSELSESYMYVCLRSSSASATLHWSYRQLGCPPSLIARFPASRIWNIQSDTSCHFSTISTDFQEKAEAVFVQPQFSVS